MKAGTHNHLKVKRLKRILKIPLYRAIGILETIWLLCIDCCDEGNIGKFSDDEIADYLEWDGDPSELVRALSDSGWTDTDEHGRPIVHDWIEHCPEFIRDRIRKRHARHSKSSKTDTAHCSEPTCDCSITDTDGQSRTDTGQDPATTVYGNSIQFNSIQSNTASAQTRLRKSKASEPEGFAEWYEAYPRHVGRARASKAYGTAVKAFMVRDNLERSAAIETLLDITKKFRMSDAGKLGNFTPEPASWLNAARYFDDQKEWTRTEPSVDKPRQQKTNATGSERPSVPVPSFAQAKAALGPGQPREP